MAFATAFRVCGLDSLLTFTRGGQACAVESLHLPLSGAWLGIGILHRSPNLTQFTHGISTVVLRDKGRCSNQLSYRDAIGAARARTREYNSISNGVSNRSGRHRKLSLSSPPLRPERAPSLTRRALPCAPPTPRSDPGMFQAVSAPTHPRRRLARRSCRLSGADRAPASP
jgi:hypothetical protein